MTASVLVKRATLRAFVCKVQSIAVDVCGGPIYELYFCSIPLMLAVLRVILGRSAFSAVGGCAGV